MEGLKMPAFPEGEAGRVTAAGDAMRIATVAERKARRARELEEACRRVETDLAAYAAEHRGRFLLFGSYVKGRLRHDSDLDIMIDFPVGFGAAWNFAEDVCRRHGVKPDLIDLTQASPGFLARVVPSSRVLA